MCTYAFNLDDLAIATSVVVMVHAESKGWKSDMVHVACDIFRSIWVNVHV